jgi:hypothetical protein
MSRERASLLLLLSLSGMAHIAAAQTEPHAAAGVIDGIVADSSLAPLDRATISVFGTRISVVTGENGRFRMLGIQPGEYVLLVRRLGYEGATTKVSVDAASATRIAFNLTPAVTKLASYEVISRPVVSMRMKEFNERKERAEGGIFITREDIVKRDPVSTMDLFRGIPSVTVPKGYSVFSTRSNCELPIMVDGLPARPEQIPPPESIAGMEVYPGPATVPLEYKSARRTPVGNYTCGLILIWTGDGR